MASKYLHRRIKHNVRWELARLWLQLHSGVHVIGVAGSVGKTSTKDVTASILSQQYEVVKSRANFDPIFNLPQTALTIRRRHRYFVAELGIDGIGQMDKYFTLVKPKTGVMTELSLEHADDEHLQSLEQAIDEEWKLIEALPEDGLAVINGDNDEAYHRAQLAAVQVITFGCLPRNDVRIVHVEQHLLDDGGQLTFQLEGMIAGQFSAGVLGQHLAYALTAGIIVGHQAGLKHDRIQAGLNLFEPPEHRMQVRRSPWGTMIDDTYNSSPKAAIAALETLAQVDDDSSVAVLGDMLELGDYSIEAHRQVGVKAAELGIQRLIVFGQFAAEVAAGYVAKLPAGNVVEAANGVEIMDWLQQHQPPLVLFKASRGMKLTEVTDQLALAADSVQ